MTWTQAGAPGATLERTSTATVLAPITKPARTYNQVHVPRKYGLGKRRFSVYWTWSYPWEANRDVSELDNRFSTMTEVRRVGWPNYESAEYSEQMFLQGIAGTLELFHLSLVSFQNLVGEVTGQPVAVYQRIDQDGQRLPIDEGTCLILGPHHDVGVSDSLKERQMEYSHHGDPLVPRQQRFGKYTRSLMKGLGVPVENRYGLRPATVDGTKRTVSLSVMQDLDTRGWMTDVSTFVFHMHLPHYAVTTDDPQAIHVLARQPIDMSTPHPFTEAGNREFNMFLWMPPSGGRAGDILLADSTIFTTLFGGDASLDHFWKNLATK